LQNLAENRGTTAQTNAGHTPGIQRPSTVSVGPHWTSIYHLCDVYQLAEWSKATSASCHVTVISMICPDLHHLLLACLCWQTPWEDPVTGILLT